MKQKTLLDFVLTENLSNVKGFLCKICGQRFDNLKGLKIHHAKIHFFYEDEGIEIERKNDHIVLRLTLRESLFHDLMKTVERSGADLHGFFSEILLSGDALFDENVRKYQTSKVWSKVLTEISKTQAMKNKTEAYLV